MSRLDEEIAGLEHRIADERAESLKDFEDYARRQLDRATSFTSLAALVVVGLIAGRLLQRRRAAGQGVNPMKLLGLVTGILPAVLRARDRRRRKAEVVCLPPGEAGPPARSEEFLAVDGLRGGPT